MGFVKMKLWWLRRKVTIFPVLVLSRFIGTCDTIDTKEKKLLTDGMAFETDEYYGE